MTVFVLVGLGVWAIFGFVWALLVVCGPLLLGLVWGTAYGLVCQIWLLPAQAPQQACITRRVVLMDMAHLPRTAEEQVPVLLEETRSYVENTR
jgi:hypothetical protein